MAMRTKKGNVTSTARKKAGMKGKRPKGKEPFPVFDHRSAMAALHLRGHGKGISSSAVIAKVRAWASRNGDKVALAACSKASRGAK